MPDETPVLCQTCKVKEADFQVRRIPARAEENETDKFLCNACVTLYLANDTASLIKLHKRT